MTKQKHNRYYQLRHELSVEHNILLKRQCIVVPTSLQHRILQIAHSQHQGIVKTKAILREKVWWPGISADVESLIKSCHACQVTTPTISKTEPIQITKIPSTPWETVAADLKGPFPNGENLLVYSTTDQGTRSFIS